MSFVYQFVEFGTDVGAADVVVQGGAAYAEVLVPVTGHVAHVGAQGYVTLLLELVQLGHGHGAAAEVLKGQVVALLSQAGGTRGYLTLALLVVELQDLGHKVLTVIGIALNVARGIIRNYTFVNVSADI